MLVETDLTVGTLGSDGLKAVLAQIARDVPVGTSGQPKAVDRDAALAEIGLELPASIVRGWFDRAAGAPHRTAAGPSDGGTMLDGAFRGGLRMASILRPKALRPGDVMAVAALANERAEEEVALFETGFATIESLGYRVQVSPLAEPGHSRWWAVATPRETAAELNRLLRDRAVRGIVALDGGRLVLSYLDLVDLEAIRADPKPIVGSSDIGGLLLALYARIGFAGIHGDVARLFAEWPDLDPARRDELADAYRGVLGGSTRINYPASDRWEAWRGGRAEGPLIGAMLNRVTRVQASGFRLEPERFDGAILFWEEAWAQTSVIWQELHALRTAGVLNRIVGMVVGAEVDLNVTPGGPDNLRDIVLDVLGDRDIPVIANVEIGHSGPNLPMPLGVRAALDADALTLSLVEPAVSS